MLQTTERRSFQINIGLMEGYSSGILHTKEEVLDLISLWMRNRMAAKLSCITGGTLIPGTMLYAWDSEATGLVVNREEVVLFVGEVSPFYNADLSDVEAVNALKDLASFLGEKLNQSRMYVMFKSLIWILQNDEIPHPLEKKSL